jgi:hypothetical protein
MPSDFTYYCSALGKRRDFMYQHATPEKPGATSTINTFGVSGRPLSARTLKGVLELFEKLTGVKLSYSRVYREITEVGVSSTVVPAWDRLRQHYEPMDIAVVLVSRAEVKA